MAWGEGITKGAKLRSPRCCLGPLKKVGAQWKALGCGLQEDGRAPSGLVNLVLHGLRKTTQGRFTTLKEIGVDGPEGGRRKNVRQTYDPTLFFPSAIGVMKSLCFSMCSSKPSPSIKTFIDCSSTVKLFFPREISDSDTTRNEKWKTGSHPSESSCMICCDSKSFTPKLPNSFMPSAPTDLLSGVSSLMRSPL